ncbi:RhoGAP domain-containing protein 1 [Elsinoe fawcettii]|nr:RhoGAP domain-containing protein 1 [Elsinoe fawcettii]
MPTKQQLRIDVSQDDSFKEVVKRMSSPINLHGIDISALDARDVPGPSPLPSSISSPNFEADRARERERDRSQSFFSNLAASKSMSRLQDSLQKVTQGPSRPSSRGSSRTEASGTSNKTTGRRVKGASPYMNKAPGSTPELTSSKFQRISRAMTNREEILPITSVSRASVQNQESQPTSHSRAPKHSHHQSIPLASYTTAKHSKDATAPQQEKRKSRFSTKRLGVLSRTKSKSQRGADAQMSSAPATPTRAIPKQTNGTPTHLDGATEVSRSASGDKDRSLKGALKASSNARTRSEDRGIPDSQEAENKAKTKAKKDKKVEEKSSRDGFSKSYHKSNGSGFFASTKSSEGFGLGKASRGFFSKLTRSSSSNEKVGMGVEEEYEPRLLKLPLIQQTRETRIAKSYDNCRDKTEFWMPALPWRCIDYLNGKCEEEGLYRVSGGLTMVRRWRKRFDTERDINLLDEADLYDASVIASLFKEWIRELPEEIFPKSRQAKVAATLPTEVPGKKPVPQAFRDELSNLPPFNYYLLFAITCHLSLLLSHEPKNKMTLDNLYRCFNQSLKLDGRVFYTLVGDWRQCWQGCYTENEFLRAEYEHLNTPFPEYPELERRPPPVDSAVEERALTSSSGSDASATGRSTPENQRPPTSHTQPSNSTGDTEPDSTPQKNETTSLSAVKV